jgi:hypothetical protein
MDRLTGVLTPPSTCKACREVTALLRCYFGADIVPLFYRTHPLVSGLQIVEL